VKVGLLTLEPIAVAFALALSSTGFSVSRGYASPAPRLTHSSSEAPASLSDYRGGVVILDFFGPRCFSCLKVSRELHQAIAVDNAPLATNAHGLKVHLVPVNVDPSEPKATARFLQKAGLPDAILDEEGRLFESFGGSVVPLIIVMDGTSQTYPDESVLAVFEGHPGTERLQQLIDQITGSNLPEARLNPTAEGFWGQHAYGTLEAGGETLLSSDFRLYQTAANWTETRTRWDTRLGVTWNRYDLDYEPAPTDFISQPTQLREDAWLVQGRLRGSWIDRWRFELSGGAYHGFADYRSVWLDYYYRSFFEPLPGYEEANPGGANVSPGLRYEVVSATTWLQGNFVYQYDRVSPGYEKEPFQPLVRGTENLHTFAGVLALEHLLSPTLRTSQSLRITDTTDRDLRYDYQLHINWAPAGDLVVRGIGGAAVESPDFHAFYGQISLEKDWNDEWFVGVFGRFYTDDGLVRDPKILSSASPPLRTWRAGLTLRFQGERLFGKLAAGPYLNDYDAIPTISQDFSTLYADRDWLFVEAAAGIRF